MARIFPTGSPAPYRRQDEVTARWRLGLALCASVATHAWLATHAGAPSIRPAAVTIASVLTARIEAPGGKSAVAGPIVAETAQQTPSDTISRRRTGSKPGRGGTAPLPIAAAPGGRGKPGPDPVMPPAVDSTWYTVQELDSYPRAETPVRLAPAPAGNEGVRLLLWLRIDEHGQVVEVSAGAPGIPAGWVEAARASLAMVRFAPARKDERAVKSRVLLSVNIAPAAGLGSRD